MGNLAALGAAALWALSNVWVRPLTAYYPPLVLNLHRVLPASLVILVFALLLGKGPDIASIAALPMAGLLGSAVLGIGLGDSLYYTSLSYVEVSRVYPIAQTTQTLVSFAIAVIFLDEDFSTANLAGAVLAIAGIYLVSRTAVPAGGKALQQARPRRGILFAFAAAVTWATALAIAKVSLGGHDAIGAFAIRLAFTGLVLAMLVRTLRLPLLPKGPTGLQILLGATGGGLFGAAGGVSLFYAFQKIGLGRTAILTALAPLFLLPLSARFGHERLTTALVTGAIVSIAGVVLVAV